MRSPFFQRLATLCCSALLFACGGVGQDGSGATPPDSYTTGVVNGFGSVVVNGIHFDVRNAAIVMDGVAGRRESDLRVGMVVEVSGTVAPDGLTGTATRLTYESLLRGRLDAVGTSLQVLGQQVVLDDTTLIAGADGAANLAVGDQLQVSGLRVQDGSLRATLVVREPASNERQLSAFVTGVSGSTVTIAGLAVNTAGAQFVDVSTATLATGQLLRVDLQAAPVGGAATATRVRLIDTRAADALPKQKRQGFVLQWNAATRQFVLEGQTVQVQAGTEYQDGTAADLATGARVEVTGLRGADGVLRADKLRFLRSTLTAYGRGRVAAVDPADRRFSLFDANTGVEVRVRAGTILNDNTGGTLSLANLAVGQEVIVVGAANGDRIEAEVVTRLANNPLGSGIAGPVASIGGGAFTLLDVPVATGLGTSFFDAQGNTVTASAFFASLQSGDLVRAEGAYAAGSLAAVTVRRVR